MTISSGSFITVPSALELPPLYLMESDLNIEGPSTVLEQWAYSSPIHHLPMLYLFCYTHVHWSRLTNSKSMDVRGQFVAQIDRSSFINFVGDKAIKFINHHRQLIRELDEHVFKSKLEIIMEFRGDVVMDYRANQQGCCSNRPYC